MKTLQTIKLDLSYNDLVPDFVTKIFAVFESLQNLSEININFDGCQANFSDKDLLLI